MANKQIQSDRLNLICCNAEILRAAAEDNTQLASTLNVQISPNWTSFDTKVFIYILEKIESNRKEKEWWTYFPVLKAENTLIGSCGYKGAPDENGIVEIGYEVAPGHRNCGLATEMAQALIQHAFTCKEVKSIIAHTTAESIASARVLEKCGMARVAELNDRLEGQIWRWKYPPKKIR